jgi:hypothetical protein
VSQFFTFLYVIRAYQKICCYLFPLETMETNDEQGQERGSARSKKQRLSRKYRGLTCANCRAKKVTIFLCCSLFIECWLLLRLLTSLMI